MPKRIKPEDYTCTVEFTPGWEKRFTQAFVDLYYQRLERGAESLVNRDSNKKASA